MEGRRRDGRRGPFADRHPGGKFAAGLPEHRGYSAELPRGRRYLRRCPDGRGEPFEAFAPGRCWRRFVLRLPQEFLRRLRDLLGPFPRFAFQHRHAPAQFGQRQGTRCLGARDPTVDDGTGTDGTATGRGTRTVLPDDHIAPARPRPECRRGAVLCRRAGRGPAASAPRHRPSATAGARAGSTLRHVRSRPHPTGRARHPARARALQSGVFPRRSPMPPASRRAAQHPCPPAILRCRPDPERTRRATGVRRQGRDRGRGAGLGACREPGLPRSSAGNGRQLGWHVSKIL